MKQNNTGFSLLIHSGGILYITSAGWMGYDEQLDITKGVHSIDTISQGLGTGFVVVYRMKI